MELGGGSLYSHFGVSAQQVSRREGSQREERRPWFSGSARLAKGPTGKEPPAIPLQICICSSAFLQLSSDSLMVIEPGPGPRHRTEEAAMSSMPISSCSPLTFLSDESTRAQWWPHQSVQSLPGGVGWVEVSGDLRLVVLTIEGC